MQISNITAACFAAALNGNYSAMLLPSAPNYAENVTVLNLNYPVTPAAITYPSSTAEVAGIVKCAAESGYKVQAKGGGHSFGNYGWGGSSGEVVINLLNLKSFSYDPNTTLAKIGSGVDLGNVTTLLHEAGNRNLPHGACPAVGIGGHGVVGGIGISSRQYGATIDHVESAQMVLANGTVATVSAAENPDLLFALKGAGASYGIVTEYTFSTVPEPPQSVYFEYVFAGGNSSSRAQVLKDFQKYIAAPALSRAFTPVLTVIPNAIQISGAFFGTLDEYSGLGFGSAFSVPPSMTNVTAVNDWLALSDIFGVQTASASVPAYFYAKNLFVKPESLIPDSTFEKFIAYADSTPSASLSYLLEFQLEGGAINDVPVGATAYPHRDVLYWGILQVITNGTVSETSYGFVEGLFDVITGGQPGVQFPSYAGYVDTRLDGAPGKYYTSNLPRLQSIKKAVDPRDVFHNPQSVPVKDGCV